MSVMIYTIAESYDQKRTESTHLFLLSYSLRCLVANVRNSRDEPVAVTHHCILQRLLQVRRGGQIVETKALGLRVGDTVQHLRLPCADGPAADVGDVDLVLVDHIVDETRLILRPHVRITGGC